MPKSIFPTLLGILAVLAALCSAGCNGAGEGVPRQVDAGSALQVVGEDKWPILFDDMDNASLSLACRQSIGYLRRIPAERKFTFGPLKVSAAEMIAGLIKFDQLLATPIDPASRTEALKKDFVLLRSVGRDGRGEVLFTGYYEPVLRARRKPAPPFVHPLYELPSDLVTINLKDFGSDLPAKKLVGRIEGKKIKPYPDREQIDFRGTLKGKAAILAYLDDPVDAFFMHIQGSGQVVFADGSRLRLGYAGVNGRPYRSVGRLLLREGLMQSHEMSMQGIKGFLARNPSQIRRILSHNPSYVFFRGLPAEGGPLGCYGIPVTGERSIATDRRLFPGLALAYIKGETPIPGGGVGPLERFVFNQDTGGAIRGPGRLDLFYGTGRAAGELAGRMKYTGELYFLAPRKQGR